MFLSGYVADGSFAPVVKNADASEDWAASLLIRVIISASVNYILLYKSQHVKAQVSLYAYSRHQGGGHVLYNVLNLQHVLKWPAEPQRGEGVGGGRETPERPDSLLPAQAAPVGQWHRIPPSCPCCAPVHLTVAESDENPYALLTINCAEI